MVSGSTTVTLRSAVTYPSFPAVGEWFPIVKFGSEIGDSPRLIESSRIQAPGGLVVISTEPVNGMSAAFTFVVFPDSTRTGADNLVNPNRENVTHWFQVRSSQ